jgi:uncharacterized protein (TIGR04255 family)
MFEETDLEQYPILSKAPITEALIDIRVKLPDSFDIRKLDLYEKINEEYATRQEIRRFETKFEIKDGQPLSDITVIKGGYRYTSIDNLYVFQSRIDGFTLSRLEPYETWERLRREGRKLWHLYGEICSPTIVRIALRYINKIMIPLPIRDFGDYFTAPPTVSEKLPQGVTSFFNRVVIHEPTIGANAIITTSMEPVSKPDLVPIILDIDVFKIKPEGFDEEAMWESLDRIRDFKNRIFYNSITERLLEVFK